MKDRAPSGSDWYVVHSKPFHEKRVTFHLHQRVASLEIFVPLIEVTHGRRNHNWNSLQPVFPGYLFATFPLEPSAWTVVRWTPGVTRILGYGDAPVAVPNEFIARSRPGWPKSALFDQEFRSERATRVPPARGIACWTRRNLREAAVPCRACPGPFLNCSLG